MNQKVDPFPGSLSSVISPPISSTSCREMLKPSRDEKEEIWINLRAARSVGANFSSQLLKIATVIDD